MSQGACFYSLQFFDKKSAGSGVNMHANKSSFDEKSAEELHKTFFEKFSRYAINDQV